MQVQSSRVVKFKEPDQRTINKFKICCGCGNVSGIPQLLGDTTFEAVGIICMRACVAMHAHAHRILKQKAIQNQSSQTYRQL